MSSSGASSPSSTASSLNANAAEFVPSPSPPPPTSPPFKYRGSRGGKKRRKSKSNAETPPTKDEKNHASKKRNQSKTKKKQQHQQTNKENHQASSSKQQKTRRKSDTSTSSSKKSNGGGASKALTYPPHQDYQDCVARYAAKDPTLVRGRMRSLPNQRNGKAFLTCDRGSLMRDVILESALERNRALDGDVVFVELDELQQGEAFTEQNLQHQLQELHISEEEQQQETWREDEVQRRLWNPSIKIAKASPRSKQVWEEQQRRGRVVCIVPPNANELASELDPSNQSSRKACKRAIVGTLKKKNGSNKTYYLLIPNNKSLPEFFCRDKMQVEDTSLLYKAEYIYGSWRHTDTWPPCENISVMGSSANVQDETMALLTENGVDHGEFSTSVFKNVNDAVDSGMTKEMEWKPSAEMCKGRRDYRKQRIFTIDPTTAKDLDDALHISKLSDGRVEIGVHIADVSHFVQPQTAVDEEAKRRATTVYLVDRTVPMLPRPLCEVACSLNEGVERLAFSCVWRMNMDGTLEKKNGTREDVWYGRTVIKSCARLDYATAQNIIENKVATGEDSNELDEKLWPASRRPTGGHSIDEVAADVRLMHHVAQARRKLRFANGALALNGVKLAFQLESDGETPMLCEPYPIRDSNRLVEEYMLLANYFVAQRLIECTGGIALLRNHEPPVAKGIDDVVTIAKEGMGFHIDSSSSQALQASLNKFARECDDELALQCLTQMLMTPMQQAKYIAAGETTPEGWRHFALNIPYYTHFTSPIRRYPDILVHRLLQATIDGQEAIDTFPIEQGKMQSIADHCNDKRIKSKYAQDRSDRVFLALYLKRHPLKNRLGVVLSVGEKTFTVFVPSLGVATLVFLDEHKDKMSWECFDVRGQRQIHITSKKKASQWSDLRIKVFVKLSVTCLSKEKPPIDVKLKLEGPWKEQG